MTKSESKHVKNMPCKLAGHTLINRPGAPLAARCAWGARMCQEKPPGLSPWLASSRMFGVRRVTEGGRLFLNISGIGMQARSPSSFLRPDADAGWPAGVRSSTVGPTGRHGQFRRCFAWKTRRTARSTSEKSRFVWRDVENEGVEFGVWWLQGEVLLHSVLRRVL